MISTSNMPIPLIIIPMVEMYLYQKACLVCEKRILLILVTYITNMSKEDITLIICLSGSTVV